MLSVISIDFDEYRSASTLELFRNENEVHVWLEKIAGLLIKNTTCMLSLLVLVFFRLMSFVIRIHSIVIDCEFR